VIVDFLVTLGDCHHLNGLVDCVSVCEARVKVVRGDGARFVRGVLLALRET
jgi:hypothetical protein